LLLLSVILFGCQPEDLENDISSNAPNQVLFLKVDYTTNTFQGGTILGFSKQTKTFSVVSDYMPPGDVGRLTLIYKELDEKIFSGTINWAGLGKMDFPEKLEPASSFKIDPLKTYWLPKNGYENLFNPSDSKLNYEKPWSAIQQLVKVREFLTENPDQKIKLFLYTPTVDKSNTQDWCWIIFLKK